MVEWLNLSQTSGSGYELISVTALPNRGGSRSTSLTISGHTSSVIIPVSQELFPYKEIPMTFEVASGGTFVLTHNRTLFDDVGDLTIQYRINGGNWTSITSSRNGTSFTVNDGDIVEFVGDNVRYGSLPLSYTTLSGSTAVFEAYGNTMSLFNSTGYTEVTDITEQYGFNRFFAGCTGLTSAENLILPTTTLPMHVYTSTFENCTSMTTAPVLPAPVLTNSCYNEMFNGCSSLNYIRCYATDISAYHCTYNWVSNVAPTGTFVKDSTNTSWSTGNNGIPTGWIVENYVNTMQITPSACTFLYTGGSQSFSVTSDADWEVTNVPSWLTVDTLSGTSGVTIISATCGLNTGDVRTEALTITGPDSSVAAVVTQNAFVNDLTITPSACTFSYTGGTQQFSIYSNYAWNITSYPNWLSIDTLSGTPGTTTITTTAQANSDTSSRTGTLVVSGLSEVASASIEQDAYVASGAILMYTSSDGNIINLSKNTIYGGNSTTSTTTKLTVVSNVYENGVGTITFNYPVITIIGESAFTQSYRLTSITIPDTVRYIGRGVLNSSDGYVSLRSGYTFYNCTALTSVSLGASVSMIGPSAFQGCSALTGITFTNNSISLMNNAFRGCSSITSLTIPNNVYLGAMKIEGANHNVNAGYANYVFGGCSGLTTLNIASGDTGDNRGIPVNAFAGCSGLTNVVIPETFQDVMSGAFDNCTSLSSLTLSSSTTRVGINAAGNYVCIAKNAPLTRINCYAVTAPTIGVNNNTTLGGFSFVNPNGVLHYPANSDYSSWLIADPSLSYYNLGTYNWTGVADL